LFFWSLALHQTLDDALGVVDTSEIIFRKKKIKVAHGFGRPWEMVFDRLLRDGRGMFFF
jgi:hypothetical protein